MNTSNRKHINRRVSNRRGPARPWPRIANQARVDSIGNAMDLNEHLNGAEKQIKAAVSAIERRQHTVALLELARLNNALIKMRLPVQQIINDLENVPANYGQEEHEDE